jgi:hypothetical protein
MPDNDVAGEWVTLRQASLDAGVSVSALRKWYRSGAIPSRMEPGVHGEHRLVELGAVRARIGNYREQTGTLPQDVPAIPEGTTLVPLEAWQQVMVQLGHLHEAGQQLADARERAGKAETEAAFFKERFAEVRDELRAATARAEAREHRGWFRRRAPASPQSQSAPGEPADTG